MKIDINKFKRIYKIYNESNYMTRLRLKHLLFIFELYNIPENKLQQYLNAIRKSNHYLPPQWWREDKVLKWRDNASI